MKNKEKGIISIFLALILIPTYTFSIASLDISRLYAGQNYIKLANEAALTSILLNYDKKLYEKYKLLAVSDLQSAKSISKKVAQENLISQQGDDNFHKFTNIESQLDVDVKDSLLDIKELERQIVDYMKYKGPLELMDGFMNMLDTVKSAKTYNNILSKKIKYNEELEKFDENIAGISKQLSTYSSNINQINSTYEEFLKDYLKLKKRLKNLKIIEDKINKKENKTQNDLQVLKGNDKTIKQIKNEFIKKYEKFSSIISKQISLNKNIKEKILLLNSRNKKLDSSLNQWKKAIENAPSKEIKSQFKSEYTFSNKAFSKVNVDALISQLEKNSSILSKINDLLFSKNGQFKNLNNTYNIFLEKSLNKEDLKVNKLSNLERYAVYKRIVAKGNKVKIDPKKKVEAKSIKKLMDTFNDKSALDINVKDSIFNYVSKEKYNSIINNEHFNESLDYKKQSITNINKNFSLLNLNLDKTSKSYINNFLLAQYISDKFSDKTINLGDRLLSQKEYIVFGNSNLDKNLTTARNLIFAIRLALNSMYGFTSPEVRKEALMLATAIAGWTGLGVPLLESILVSAMSFGETIVDSNKLTKGENLGLFKNKTTWTFSIAGIKRLAKESALNFAKDGLDNIMDSIEQIALEAKDKSFETLGNFINKTSSGVEQSIVGGILIPIQNKIVDLINDPSKDISKELDRVFKDLKLDVNHQTNPGLYKLKTGLLSLLEKKYKNKILSLINKKEEIDNESIIELIEQMSSNISEQVQNFTKSISNDLESKISNIISSKTKNYHIEIQNAIDSYLNRFSATKNDKTKQFSRSGLSFTYSDYIKLFTFIKLNSNEKADILNRLSLVVDIEMNNINKNFNITNTYTNFKINTKAEIPMIVTLFGGKNKKRVIENEMQISYQK